MRLWDANKKLFLGRLRHFPELRRTWFASTLCVFRIHAKIKLLGPGNCLGLLASKSGPTAVRGQFYGVAAAIGKIGAFIGTWG